MWYSRIMTTTTLINLALTLAFALYVGKPRPWFNGPIPLEDANYEYDPEAREVRLTRRAQWAIRDAHENAQRRWMLDNETDAERAARSAANVRWALAHVGVWDHEHNQKSLA